MIDRLNSEKMKYFLALDLFVIVHSKVLCSNAGKKHVKKMHLKRRIKKDAF